MDVAVGLAGVYVPVKRARQDEVVVCRELAQSWLEFALVD